MMAEAGGGDDSGSRQPEEAAGVPAALVPLHMAKRRPDWGMRSLHEGLQLSSLDELRNSRGRQDCPNW